MDCSQQSIKYYFLEILRTRHSPSIALEVEDHDFVLIISGRHSTDDIKASVVRHVNKSEIVKSDQKFGERRPGFRRLR